MSGVLGTQLEEDYIQVGDVKLPLPKSPKGRGEEYEMLRTTPLEPFQASVVIGDDSLISDDRIAQAVFSDFRPGLGKRRYNEVDGLTGYGDGDLDTNDSGYVTLPHLPVAVNASGGALGAAWRTPAGVSRMVTGFGYDNDLTAGATFSCALWIPDETALAVYDRTLPGWRTGTGLGASTVPLAGLVRWGGLYVCCTQTTIYTSTDGYNFTARWVPGGTLQCKGLVEHDNKLYVVIQDFAPAGTIRLYWVATQAQLTVGTAWPASSLDAFPLQPNELVINIVDWKDKIDDRQIFVITNFRIIAYNDADFWSFFSSHYQYNLAIRPAGFVNPRDDLLYTSFGGLNKAVKVYNHQTIEDVGPWREGGFAAGAISDFSIVQMFGNSRWVFAFCRSRNASGAGRVLRANDSFGWSTAVRATQADPADFDSAVTNNLTGGFYFGDYLYVVMASGAVNRLFFPDRGDLAPYNTDVVYDAGPRWLYTAEFDAGHEDGWKLAKWWRILLETLTGAYSLGAGQEFLIKWQIDGGAWSSVTTLTSASTFPATVYLPSFADQRGLPFRKLRFAYALDGGTTSTATPPLVRAVTLAYTREPDIYDGLQVVVDLSRERWDQLPNSLFYGLDRAALRNYLDTLKSGPGTAKRHYPVTIGWAGYQKVYASCDVRVSGVEDPQDRYGHFSLTLREVTAPPSG